MTTSDGSRGDFANTSPPNRARARWIAVAAPEADLPAAVSGGIRPEAILRAVHDIEQALDAFDQWLRDIQLCLFEDGGGSEERAAPPPRALDDGPWRAGDFRALLHDSPLVRQLDATLDDMLATAARVILARTADMPVATADYRDFIEATVTFRHTARRVLSDAWNRLANIDPLTGLGNRAAMLRKLAIECERHERGQLPCCVALLDIDFFKRINDQYGHLAGDAVLRSLASLFAAGLRPYDAVFRYGGDEFVLCLPNADLRAAWAIVDRLRGRAAAWPVPIRDGRSLRMTISVGLAPLLAALGVEASLELADSALYAAKRAGRNGIFIHGV